MVVRGQNFSQRTHDAMMADIMTIKTTLRRRCDGHNDAIIASCVRWDSFCPIWTKNRDGSKCNILFDFPWHIVVETMHLFRDLKKIRGWKLPSIPNIPNIYLGSTFPGGLMHACPQPKKWTLAFIKGISKKMLMQMIIGSLLLIYCLHFSFIGRGDQHAAFKKMKDKHFYDQ